MPNHILLTGVTGFLGTALLERFLAQDPDNRVLLLIRGSKKESAAARLKTIVANLPPVGVPIPVDGAGASAAAAGPSDLESRVELVEGDIEHERLGLDQASYDALAKRVTQVVHSAATVRFDLPIEEARRINTQGTARMLDFARACKAQGQLRRFDYVGTAYVAGRRSGIIRESELDKGQEFSNTYEQSKFEAETKVRAAMSELPITIFRPSIIVGNSRTGETNNFRGFYWPLRLYVRRLVLVIPGDPETRVDLIPVDYVADSIAYLIKHQAPRGECYHITAGLDRTSSLGELVGEAERFFNIPVPRFIRAETYKKWVRPVLKLLLRGPRRMAMEKGAYFLPYLSSGLRFDNANTLRDLQGSGLVAPRPDEYFLTVLKYAKENWGGKGKDKED